MPRHVGAAQAEDGRCDEAGQGEEDCGEKRLSHEEGVRIMSPSPFILEWLQRIAAERGSTRRALDVACGRGRHAVPLARAGFKTFGVDADCAALAEAVEHVASAGARLHAWCADLSAHPLPVSRFDIIV